MKTNLIDELLLLGLNDSKGDFDVDLSALAYGLGGALVLELILNNRISIVSGVVRIKDSRFIGEPIIDKYFQKIMESKKERELSFWIESLSTAGEDLKYTTIDKLVAGGILRMSKEKVLWVFNTNRYPARNATPENRLRKRLNDIIVKELKPELREAMLLSMINSCGMVSDIFGSSREKAYKRRIKEIAEGEEVAVAAGKAIKEVKDHIDAAVMTAVTTSLVTTTIINS